MSVMCCARGTTVNLRMALVGTSGLSFASITNILTGPATYASPDIGEHQRKIDGGLVEDSNFVRMVGKVSELK